METVSKMDAGRWTRREKKALPVLLLAAFIVRLIALGRAGLWQDESILVNIMANPAMSVGETACNYWNIIISMAQLPLAGIVQNAWMHLLKPWLGDAVIYNTFWLRIPMVLAGTFSVLGILLAARRLLNRPAAWCAALMSAFFFFPIYYSREVYCYAYILMFASFGLYYWLRAMSEERPHAAIGLMLCMTGLAYSHLAGVIFLCSLLAVTGGGWMWYLLHRDSAGMKRLFVAGLAGGIALIAISPYFIHFLRNNTAHTSGSAIHVPILVILNDSLSKMFLGEHAPGAVLAWVLLIAGLGFLIWHKRKPFQARLLAALLFVGFFMLALATNRSQYISARYFSPLTPVFYLIFAEALSGLAARFRKPIGREAVLFGLTGVLVIVHLTVFLPPYYRLKAKSVDFGSIAQWLNKNLEPGTPYLMESAYELRFVGGYFPTPGKTGVAPYTHGSGPGELERLHAAQQQFMQRFPEAPFIESAHHDWDQPGGVWRWPKQFHPRHVQLRNEPLRALIRLGIYPGAPHEAVTDYSYVTDIYYSTPADIAQKARERGDAAIFRWAGWNCVPCAQDPQTRIVEYGRAVPGTAGKLRLENLSGAPVKGRIRLDLAVAAPPGAVDIYLRLPPGAPVSFRRSAGQFHVLESSEIELPADGMSLEAGVMGVRAASVQGILIRDAQFVCSEGRP